MNFNFSTIKLGFESYLKNLKEKEGNDYTTDLGAVSMFLYGNEFKDYIVNELGMDSSVFSQSLDEIINMDVKDGQLVSDSFQSEPDSNNFMAEIFNAALENEQVISVLDSNKNGKLDDNEIDDFALSIGSEQNENKGIFSFENLANAIQSIFKPETEELEDPNKTEEETEELKEADKAAEETEESKEADKAKEKTEESKEADKAAEETEESKEADKAKEETEESKEADKTEEETEELKDADKAEEETEESKNADKDKNETEETKEDTPNKTQSPSSGGGAGSPVGSVGGASPSSPSLTPSDSLSEDNDTKDGSYDNLSIEELESKKTSKTAEVDEAYDDINKVHSGENESVKSAQDDMDEAKENYDEAVENDENISDELKQQREDNLNKIDEKQSDIDNLNIQVNDIESKISSQNIEISSDESNISAIESAISALPSSTDPKKQTEISNKKSDLESKLKIAQEKLSEDKDTLSNYEKELKELESDLKLAESEKDKLEKEKSEIEDKILENCSQETKEALNKYNEAKENVETVKEEELQKAEENLELKQSELDEINTILNEKKTEQTKEDEKIQTTGSLREGIFNANGALSGKEKLVEEAAEKYGLDPKFLAAIVCLESGYGTSNLAVNHNNFGGVTGTGDNGSTSTGFASYSSVESGLDAMAKNLAGYSDRFGISSIDVDHAEEIGARYCPGTYRDWANQVRSLYNQI